MDSSRLILAGLLIALSAPTASEACARRGCAHHRRVVATRCAQPVPTTMVAAAPQPASYASPQAPQAVAAAPVAGPTVAAPAGVQPTYDYAAAPNGQPAYYYTYDSSGKLIVAQWMDWVFRGGRAAGEPAPPLPIIGALRGR